MSREHTLCRKSEPHICEVKQHYGVKSWAPVSREEFLRVMRMPEVCEVTQLSEATVRRKLQPTAPQYDPTFPKPFSLSIRAKGFDGAAVLAWCAAQNDAVQGECP